MRLIVTRIFPIAAVLITVVILMSRSGAAPKTPTAGVPAAPVPTTSKPASSSSANMAAVARKARPGSNRGRTQTDAHSTNDTSTTGAPTVQVDAYASLWSQFFQRHAEGDENAFPEFLNAITGENALSAWRVARKAKLSPDDRSDLYAETQEGNQSARFRYFAIEALEPVRDDPTVREWLTHLAQNDSEAKLANRASLALGIEPQAPKR